MKSWGIGNFLNKSTRWQRPWSKLHLFKKQTPLWKTIVLLHYCTLNVPKIPFVFGSGNYVLIIHIADMRMILRSWSYPRLELMTWMHLIFLVPCCKIAAGFFLRSIEITIQWTSKLIVRELHLVQWWQIVKLCKVFILGCNLKVRVMFTKIERRGSHAAGEQYDP